MKIYFDENMPKLMVEGLAILIKKSHPDYEIIFTPTEFGKGILDPDLLPLISNENGVLITNDIKMGKRYKELIEELSIIIVLFKFKNNSDYWHRVKFTVNKWELFINDLNDEKPYLINVHHDKNEITKVAFNGV